MEEEISPAVNSYRESLYQSQTISESKKSYRNKILLFLFFAIFISFLISCALFFYQKSMESIRIIEARKAVQVIPVPETATFKQPETTEETAFPDLNKAQVKSLTPLLEMNIQAGHQSMERATPENTPTSALPVHAVTIPAYSETQEVMNLREENNKLMIFNEKLLEENQRLRNQILSQSDHSAKQKVNNGKIVLDATIPRRIETDKPWSLIVD